MDYRSNKGGWRLDYFLLKNITCKKIKILDHYISDH